MIDAAMQNYYPLQSNATFGDGRLWQKINREEGSNLEQYYNGMAFAEEAPTTSLVKTMGLIAGGSLFFSAAAAYHLGKTGYEVFRCGEGIWERLKLAKRNNHEVNLWSFIQSQERQIYLPSLQSTSQMIKSYACLIPFAMLPLPHLINPPTWILSSLHPAGWLTDTNLGLYVGLGFIVYAMHDPRYPKVVLNQIENWIVTSPMGSTAIEEEKNEAEEPSSVGVSGEMEMEGSSSSIEISKKDDLYKPGILYRIQELFEFKVPASHHLGWTSIDMKRKKKKDE